MSNTSEKYKNVNKTVRTSESILLHIRVHESEGARDQDIVYAVENRGYLDQEQELRIRQNVYARLRVRCTPTCKL